MKVLLLGGAGDMAIEALREMGKDRKTFEHVSIVDLNVDKGRKIIDDLGLSDIASVINHDITDKNWLVETARDHNAVLGFAGPFYVMEKYVSECCIEAGVNYVSICDDYDAYLSVWELDSIAKSKGIKILTGWGNSPGLTQILARKGYNSMEKCRRINIHWAAGSNESVGATNLNHLFHILHGTTLQTLRGKEQPVPTGGGRKVVEFPEPIGKLPVFYTGHAESVSIPRNLPGLEEVTLHGGVQPPYIVRLVKGFDAIGLFETHERRRKAANFFHKIEGLFAAGGADKSVGRIDVFGVHKSRAVHRYYTYVGHIAVITSVPAVQALAWLNQGKWNDVPGGVYSAERLLTNPDPFLKELMERGLEIYFYE